MKKLLLCLMFALPALSFASSSIPYPFKIFSENGQYYVQMTPEKASSWKDYKGKGEVFSKDGTSLYTVNWYGLAFLSNDGQNLIGFGDWSYDREKFKDLALIFFNNGKEAASYTVDQLLQNKAAVQPGKGNYFWQNKQKSGLSTDGKTYVVAVMGGSTYQFDINTGEMLNNK